MRVPDLVVCIATWQTGQGRVLAVQAAFPRHVTTDHGHHFVNYGCLLNVRTISLNDLGRVYRLPRQVPKEATSETARMRMSRGKMSALGQKRTCALQKAISALPE
jgi:hypothetical protein